MRAARIVPRSAGPRAQRGIATILIVLLTGLALSAMVFGAVSYVRGVQARSFTTHAATQAQLQAWSAAEAVRQYLVQLGNDLADLEAGQAIEFEGDLAAVDGSITAVTPSDASFCGGATRVQVALVGTGGPARSGLDVVYCVTAAATKPGGLPFSGNNIRGPLSISGGHQFKGNGTTRLVVDGDISGNGSIVGYDAIYATGSVQLSGYSAIGSLTAEGDIDVEGTFTTLASMGDVKLRGGDTKSATIHANGSVTDTNGGSFGTIEAIGDVNLTDGTRAVTVHSKGSVSGRSSTVTGEALAERKFKETGCCSNVAGGAVGDEVALQSSRNPSAKVNLAVRPGLKVDVAEVTKQDVDRTKVDVNDYKASANYVFAVDGNGNKTVTVRNVSGLTDGKTYYVAGSGGRQDFLCETSTYSDATCSKKICTGYSDYNTCFSYWNGNWSLNGPKDKTILPPGIVYFVGSVTVGSGQYFDTLLASGNISSASDTFVTAPNYADAAKICANPQFPTLVPTNLCVGGQYVAQPITDVALMAGSYDDAGKFNGGLVSLGAYNEIRGTVVAGDRIETAGNTTIAGYIFAAYQSAGKSSNSFGAKTTIDQTTLRTTEPPTASSGGGGAAGVNVLWTRYR